MVSLPCSFPKHSSMSIPDVDFGNSWPMGNQDRTCLFKISRPEIHETMILNVVYNDRFPITPTQHIRFALEFLIVWHF